MAGNLVLKRLQYESLEIQIPGREPIQVTVIELDGNFVKLGFIAGSDVQIWRSEIAEAKRTGRASNHCREAYLRRQGRRPRTITTAADPVGVRAGENVRAERRLDAQTGKGTGADNPAQEDAPTTMRAAPSSAAVQP